MKIQIIKFKHKKVTLGVNNEIDNKRIISFIFYTYGKYKN